MALQFLESGQLGDITDDGRWNDADGGGYAYSTDTPRSGTNCIASQLGDNRNLSKTTGLTAVATMIVGFAYRPSGISSTAFILVNLRDAGTSQVYVQQETTGYLTVRRGDATVLGTSNTRVQGGQWQYIELKATINNSTGAFELRIDGNNVTSGTSVDTQNTGNATVDQVIMGYHGDGSTYNYRFDDLYIADSTGSNNNDFLGDVAVECLYPDGDGNSSGFTPQGGGDNYVEVDEAGASDDDTTYVESNSAGTKDTYTFGNLSMTDGSVLGVIVNGWAKKDVAAARNLILVARSSTSETDSSANALDTTYDYHAGVFETDPNGGGSWDISAINAAEFGIKIS